MPTEDDRPVPVPPDPELQAHLDAIPPMPRPGRGAGFAYTQAEVLGARTAGQPPVTQAEANAAVAGELEWPDQCPPPYKQTPIREAPAEHSAATEAALQSMYENARATGQPKSDPIPPLSPEAGERAVKRFILDVQEATTLVDRDEIVAPSVYPPPVYPPRAAWSRFDLAEGDRKPVEHRREGDLRQAGAAPRTTLMNEVGRVTEAEDAAAYEATRLERNPAFPTGGLDVSGVGLQIDLPPGVAQRGLDRASELRDGADFLTGKAPPDGAISEDYLAALRNLPGGTIVDSADYFGVVTDVESFDDAYTERAGDHGGAAAWELCGKPEEAATKALVKVGWDLALSRRAEVLVDHRSHPQGTAALRKRCQDLQEAAREAVAQRDQQRERAELLREEVGRVEKERDAVSTELAELRLKYLDARDAANEWRSACEGIPNASPTSLRTALREADDVIKSLRASLAKAESYHSDSLLLRKLHEDLRYKEKDRYVEEMVDDVSELRRVFDDEGETRVSMRMIAIEKLARLRSLEEMARRHEKRADANAAEASAHASTANAQGVRIVELEAEIGRMNAGQDRADAAEAQRAADARDYAEKLESKVLSLESQLSRREEAIVSLGQSNTAADAAHKVATSGRDSLIRDLTAQNNELQYRLRRILAIGVEGGYGSAVLASNPRVRSITAARVSAQRVGPGFDPLLSAIKRHTDGMTDEVYKESGIKAVHSVEVVLDERVFLAIVDGMAGGYGAGVLRSLVLDGPTDLVLTRAEAGS